MTIFLVGHRYRDKDKDKDRDRDREVAVIYQSVNVVCVVRNKQTKKKEVFISNIFFIKLI